MFKPTITKEWLLATMELECDGFCNAGGIPSETLDSDEIDAPSCHHKAIRTVPDSSELVEKE